MCSLNFHGQCHGIGAEVHGHSGAPLQGSKHQGAGAVHADLGHMQKRLLICEYRKKTIEVTSHYKTKYIYIYIYIIVYIYI